MANNQAKRAAEAIHEAIAHGQAMVRRYVLEGSDPAAKLSNDRRREEKTESLEPWFQAMDAAGGDAPFMEDGRA